MTFPRKNPVTQLEKLANKWDATPGYHVLSLKQPVGSDPAILIVEKDHAAGPGRTGADASGFRGTQPAPD